MAECECLPKCLFFNDMMAHMPDTSSKTKQKYCRGDNTHCARYMVFKVLGREKVPADLFPVQVYRVDDIIMYGKG